MKQLIPFFLLAILPQLSYCQSIPSIPVADNKIVYTAAITTAPSISTETLFGNAEQWYTTNFETADNTLTINNVNDGLLSGTGIIHGKNDRKAEPGDVFFTIDIRIEKGKYEYNVHDLYGFDKTGKFYYSEMYTEQRYPPAKPKWPADYRQTMLTEMNNKVTAMISNMQHEILIPKPKK